MSDILAPLLVPWLLGITWLSAFGKKLNWATIIGYGYLLGILLTTLLLRGWDLTGLPMNYSFLMVILVVLALLPIAYRGKAVGSEWAATSGYMTGWQRSLFVLLLAILLLRHLTMLVEIYWLPLYPWDAWMNWAPKARIWFEHQTITPIVRPMEWLNQEQLVYTLGNREAWPYPISVPLIQFWTAMGLDQWRDDWINFPWLLCSIALGFGFYGQARLMSVPPHIALLFTYLLLSMPYINLHTMLAGYADLWMAASFGFSAIAFFNWSVNKQPIQFVLMTIFAALGLGIKTPGLLWLLVLLPAVMIAFLPKRWQPATVGLVLLATVAIAFSGGINVSLPYMGIIEITPQRLQIPGLGVHELLFTDISQPLLLNLLVFSNWHLLGFILILGFVWLLFSGRILRIPLPWLILSVTIILALFMIFFMVPRYSGAAIKMVTLNRGLLHVMPTLLFVSMLAYQVGTGNRQNPTTNNVEN
ncbi:MAG: hypothetical protein ACWA5Q_11750 [bacterium]